MSKQGQVWALPPAAQVAVCVFGMIGISGLIGAILTLELLDYSYFWLLLFLAVVTGQAKVRLIAAWLAMREAGIEKGMDVINRCVH